MLTRAPTHVIFDLDGTLVDTEPLYTEATQAVVGRFGKTFDWELKRHIIGGPARKGAELLIERLALPLSPEQYLSEREVLMRKLCETAPLMRGAEALVSALHARGVPLAIGTSSDRALTTLKLSSHALREKFRVIVCGDDPAVGHPKPAPDVFLVVAERLGAEPASCLVFEDTPNGVAAARAAGMQVIAVPDPQMRNAKLDGAAAIVDSLESVSLAALGL